jgi:hypothetical protein
MNRCPHQPDRASGRFYADPAGTERLLAAGHGRLLDFLDELIGRELDEHDPETRPAVGSKADAEVEWERFVAPNLPAYHEAERGFVVPNRVVARAGGQRKRSDVGSNQFGESPKTRHRLS